MPKSWNLSTAKANLSALVDRALKGEPQRIERRGETVVVVAGPIYEKMNRPKRSLLELFSSHPESTSTLTSTEHKRTTGRSSSCEGISSR